MSDYDESIEWQRVVRELAEGVPGVTPGRIELELRAAIRRRGFRRRLRLGLGGIATVLVVFIFGWRVSMPQPIAQLPMNYAGFMALPYAQSDVPMEQAVVVRATLRPNDLERLGFPHALPSGGNGVHVELLIGQDGMARAVRLTEQH